MASQRISQRQLSVDWLTIDGTVELIEGVTAADEINVLELCPSNETLRVWATALVEESRRRIWGYCRSTNQKPIALKG